MYDVLSGRFLPPSDPQRRHHTLARLMKAAHQKGEEADVPVDEDAPLVPPSQKLYRPSWARAAEVTVMYHESGMFEYGVGLILRNTAAVEPVADLVVTHHVGEGKLSVTGLEPILLDLAGDLNGQQKLVAAHAEEFFRTIPH
jgi:hypothetical protein